MNKKLFLICSFMAATATVCQDVGSKSCFDPNAARKALSYLNPINDEYQRMKEKIDGEIHRIYSPEGIVAVSALSALLGLNRWIMMAGGALVFANIETLIRFLEKEIEKSEKSSKEQQKS